MTSTVPSAPTAIEPLVVPGAWTSLYQRLMHVVGAQPDALAVSAPGGSVTYAQLADRIDRYATSLAQVLPAGDEPVGVLVDHDLDAVVLPFALMRLDRVYVHIDPGAPADRVRDVVELAGMHAVVVDEGHRAIVDGRVEGLTVIVPELPEAAADLPEPRRSGTDAAFIVFTSGSTGTPKGVVEPHVTMLNDASTMGSSCAYEPGDRVSMLWPMPFVVAPIFIGAALFHGASLHVLDARHTSPRGVIEWIRESGVAKLGMSPHLLRSLTSELREGEPLDGVRSFLTAGEAIMGQDVEAFRSHLTAPADYINCMGSSEAASTAALVIPGDRPAPDGTLPAGRIVANREVWLLSDAGERVPQGETGNMVVVSEYLSGGYWRNDALNAEKFGVLPDGRRTYRLGDLARFDEEGRLMLIGRSDTAVKVRGYLVDMSEIENALRANPRVSELLVLPVVEPGQPTRLIAYVVQRSSVRPDSVAELRKQLRAKLPEYMVPGTIVPMDALPRNERGKVDRSLLPQPAEPHVDATLYTQHEQVVSGIWSAMLGLDAIPLDGDFLALGGDSLSVEEMLADVHDRFGVQLSSADLLAAPTLAEFAAVVARGATPQREHDDMVHLRHGQDGERLFCFAGAGALALQFLPLSRHLDGWDVRAFQAHGLEKRAVPDWSVAAHAERFLKLVRQVQPHGPYRLAGHSFGGMVALEIAQRLRAAGEEVRLLAVLDSFLPENAEAEASITANFGRLQERPAARGARQLLASVLPRPIEQGDGGVSRMGVVKQAVQARTAGLVQYDGQAHFDAFFEQGVLATRGYRPDAYDGRTLIVRCDANPNTEQQLRRIFTGDVQLTSVDCEHSALLREPYVRRLSGILGDALGAVPAEPVTVRLAPCCASPTCAGCPASSATPSAPSRPSRSPSASASPDPAP